MYENRIKKPSAIVKREREDKKVIEGLNEYIILIYRTITMKFLCTINVS
jgi:hypothetical protein